MRLECRMLATRVLGVDPVRDRLSQLHQSFQQRPSPGRRSLPPRTTSETSHSETSTRQEVAGRRLGGYSGGVGRSSGPRGLTEVDFDARNDVMILLRASFLYPLHDRDSKFISHRDCSAALSARSFTASQMATKSAKGSEACVEASD